MEAAQTVAGGVISFVIRRITTILVGHIFGFLWTFLFMIPTVGWVGTGNVCLVADGECVGEAIVDRQYIAWCEGYIGTAFDVPQYIVIEKKSGPFWWNWTHVATHQVITTQEVYDLQCLEFFAVLKQPLVFDDTGTYKLCYGECVYIEVIFDEIPPVVTEYGYGTHPTTNMHATFNEDMNEATITNSTVTVYGSQSGYHTCAFSFDHNTYELTIDPAVSFNYGEMITVTIGMGVQDIAGNGLAAPFSFDFSIDPVSGPIPTQLDLSAAVSPNTNVPPYSNVNVAGVVTYNTGPYVPVGTAIINTENNSYTAAINNGYFSRDVQAPDISSYVSVTAYDNQYSLAKSTNLWIDIQGSGSTAGYNLTTDIIYDYVDYGTWVEWYPKTAFRTTDEYVNLFANFDNLNITNNLDLMWRFFYPDGNQYNGDLIWNDAILSSWTWGWATWGFLIAGNSMSYHPGRYSAEFYVNGDRKVTHEYVVAWDFTEHRLCRDVQTSTPYLPIGETDVFLQTDTKVTTWANFDLVAQEGELKCIFYEPSGALYYEVNTNNSPSYHLPDPGAPHSWYDWARVWAWIWIDGYAAAQKCGDWRAEFFVKNPTSNVWEKYYDEYFMILEDPPQNPDAAVHMVPDSPIETQPISLIVICSDNTYLENVNLYWNDGAPHEIHWDSIYASDFCDTVIIGPFESGVQCEYWAVAEDACGNDFETVHRTVTVSPEIVSCPNRPSGPRSLRVNQTLTYHTGGSLSNLGDSIEYLFDWGDNMQSPWGPDSQSKAWTDEGVYYLKARARCQIHPEHISEWSSSYSVIVDSSRPVVEINTNNGLDFATNQTPVTLEGVVIDSNPSSGLDSVVINSGELNSGTQANWLFLVNPHEGFNIYVISAYDGAGNSGCDSIIIEYDSISPIQPVLNNPIMGTYLDTTSVVFEWSQVQDLGNRYESYMTVGDKEILHNSRSYGDIDIRNSEIRYVIHVDTTEYLATNFYIETLQVNIDTTELAEGKYFWRVMAFDLAGNQGQFSTTDSFGVDETDPSMVYLVSPLTNAYLSDSNINLTWHSAFDSLSGVNHYLVQYALNSSFTQGLVETTSIDTTLVVILSDTTYYWRVKAVDFAGNGGIFSTVWQFEVDTDIPAAPVLIAPENGVYLSDTIITLEWGEVIDGRTYRLDNLKENKIKEDVPPKTRSSPIWYVLQVDTVGDFTAPIIIDTLNMTSIVMILPEWVYYWRVKAFDLAGNQGPYANSHSFGVDITAPMVFDLISPPDSTFLITTRPTFIWEKSDDSLSGIEHFAVYINDTLKHVTSDTIWNADYDLCEGYNNWYILAYDSAGNIQQSADVWVVIIDTTPPSEVNPISPVNMSYLDSNTVNLVWHSAFDSLSGVNHYLVQYALNSSFTQGLVETTSIDTTLVVILSDTTYYWRVKAVDFAGNGGIFSAVWQFEVDTNTPVMPMLISPIEGCYLSDTLVTYEWSTVIDVSTSGSNVKNIGAEVRSTGYRDSPIFYILQVDTLPDFAEPVIVDTLDTTSTTVVHAEDLYYWRVMAYDLAGNQGPYTDPDSFGVDIIAPDIESTTIWIDTSYSGPFEICTKITDNLSGVDSVTLNYKRDQDPNWISTTMHQAGTSSWFVDTIPPVTDPYDTVRYYIEAIDNAEPGNEATDPAGAPAIYYSYLANCTGITELSTTPTSFYFKIKKNPTTNRPVFQLNLPSDAVIELRIYDVTGRLIDTPVNHNIAAGYYDITWSSYCSAGVYFYFMRSPWASRIGKIVLLK